MTLTRTSGPVASLSLHFPAFPCLAAPPPPPIYAAEDAAAAAGNSAARSTLNVGKDRLKIFQGPPKRPRVPHYYQEDLYMRQGRLLQVATAAEESIERVCARESSIIFPPCRMNLC